MATISGEGPTPFDSAVMRGWVRGRAGALVLGAPSFAEAIADLAPTVSLESADPTELAEAVSTLPMGAVIINAGARRVAAMKTIRRSGSVPLTVLWHRYARRFGDHRIERSLTPVRLISGWAVFELAGPVTDAPTVV